jgi:hypothetical protein
MLQVSSEDSPAANEEPSSGISITRRDAENPTVKNSKFLWWDRYTTQLSESDLSADVRKVIADDCDYIVDKGIFGSGPAGSPSWPDTRVRQGLVMGAVQSGKTASLIGVVAKSIDAGVDVVIVLAGTRTSLWQQTYWRIVDQLNCGRNAEGLDKEYEPILRPEVANRLASDEASWSTDSYTISRASIRWTLEKNRPIILVGMKNVWHLQALSKLIHTHLLPQAQNLGRPIHMVVLDDEADDGSILDARVEQGLDPASANLKQLPPAIVDLWSDRRNSESSASPLLYATYIGYTATPQANFLQADYNPLYPKDFVISLRTPSDTGELSPREVSFREPRGLKKYYTGGEIFYRRLQNDSLCPTSSGDWKNDVADSVRAYLVAGAIRLIDGTTRLPPSETAGKIFATRADAKSLLPEPHSMLIHPSAEIEDQFNVAESLLEWAFDADPDYSRKNIENGERIIPPALVAESIERDEEVWLKWIDSYSATALSVRDTFSLPEIPRVASRNEWPELKRLIVEELVPNTRISVVNSHDEADDQPNFDPIDTGSGWRSRTDLFSIFVSGNVMSRGLTLEGLSTTLFLRDSSKQVADTRMQMQRWFGYRGPYLHLCRVFLLADQLQNFKDFHEEDVALRRQVLASMNENPETAPQPTVLQGINRLATAKISGLTSVPLSPGSGYPFIQRMNSAEHEDPNARVVGDLFHEYEYSEVTANKNVLGYILNNQFSLTETAELLDSLTYEDYLPDSNSFGANRWKSLEAQIWDDAQDPLRPLYRPPALSAGNSPSELDTQCPYSIAAYLRLWAACTTRYVDGLQPTDNPRSSWNMVDLTRKRLEQPAFNIGIRFGAGKEIDAGCLSQLKIQAMNRKREVISVTNFLTTTFTAKRA